MSRIAAAALAVTAFLTIAPRPASAQSNVVAIENARIVVVSGPAIERGTVVVQDGKIAAVGAGVAVPAGARRIDASGMTVFPGLVESYSGLGLAEISSIAATNDFSELGEMSPQLRAYEAYNPHSELIRAARINGITTAVSFPSGGVLAGQPVITDLWGRTVEEVALRPSVGLFFNFPRGVGGRSFDFATFTQRRSSDTEAKLAQEKKLDEIRALVDDARAYVAARNARVKDATLPPLEHDLRLEALQPFVSGELPVIVQTEDFRDVRRAVEFCESAKLKMVLVTGARFGTSRIDDVAAYLAQKRVPVVVLSMYSLPQNEDDRYDLPQEVPGALARAGVKFCFGMADTAQSKDLPYQAAMAVAYGGLSKEDALRALTLWPAEIWGVADRIGSIEVGKAANLVVATGDIMEPRSDVKHVFIRGREIPLTSRQTELYEQFRDR